jgi:hypothetical protein
MKLVAHALALAVLGLAVSGSPATAARSKVRKLDGHVMATPYISNRRVVVPVLLDQRSVRRAKLRAPVGVLLLKKAKKVMVAGQRARIAPAYLRAGDRLRARAKVAKRARRAPYWRLSVRSFKVTKRAQAMSPAELQTLFGNLAGDLGRLQVSLAALAKYVQTGFANLGGDMSAMRADLATLGTALAALEKRVDDLEAGLPALEARLQSQIDSLEADLAALGTQVSGLQSQLAALQTAMTALQGDVTGLEGDVAGLQGDVAALQTSVAQLTTNVAQLQTAVSALCGPTSLLDSLC